MSNSISIATVVADHAQRLGFEWVAGRDGGTRLVAMSAGVNSTIGTIGHMNFIHPFQIQLIGPVESSYLEALPETERLHALDGLFFRNSRSWWWRVRKVNAPRF